MNENREAHQLLLSESGCLWRKWGESGSGNRMTSTNLCCFVIMALDMPSEKNMSPVSQISSVPKNLFYLTMYETFPCHHLFKNNHKNPGEEKGHCWGHPKKKTRRILVGWIYPWPQRGRRGTQSANQQRRPPEANSQVAEVEGRGCPSWNPWPKWPKISMAYRLLGETGWSLTNQSTWNLTGMMHDPHGSSK